MQYVSYVYLQVGDEALGVGAEGEEASGECLDKLYIVQYIYHVKKNIIRMRYI